MNRRPLEGIVVILAMCRGSAHQRRAAGIEASDMADGGAATGFTRCCEHCVHVIFVAGGNAEAGKIEQRVGRCLSHGFRDIVDPKIGCPVAEGL